MNREKFEALPEIVERVDDGWISFRNGVYWNKCLQRKDDWLNGAYYAFCEQQKKIDLLLDAICGTHEDFKNDRARD